VRREHRRYARRLILVSGLLLAYWVVMAVLAISQDWPAEFDTTAADDPETLAEWVVRGSLVHAPLAPLIVQAALTLLASLRGRGWVAAAGIGLTLVGAVYTIGFLGEPLLEPERSDPPLVLYAAVRVIGLGLVAAMIVLGVLTAVRALRR
jgi:hypothetical protein